MLDVSSQSRSLASAVSSAGDLISTRFNPAPDGAIAGRIKARDGTALRFVRWPAQRARRGTVCLFQGRAEFIEKYFEVVRELLDRGFAVAALDWRGQGLSHRPLRDPRKGHVANFAEYDRDVEVFMRTIVLPDSPPPYYALGHSMAGATLLRMAHQGKNWFDRTVLSAPMIGLAGAGSTATAKITARWLRRVGLGRAYIPGGGATAINTFPFEGNALTSDEERYQRTARLIEVAPQLALGSPTIGWLATAFDQMAAFEHPEFARRIQHPLLIVAAGSDKVVSTATTELFGSRLLTGSRVVIPGAQHEILMEQDRYRDQFWAAFDAFVPSQI